MLILYRLRFGEVLAHRALEPGYLVGFRRRCNQVHGWLLLERLFKLEPEFLEEENLLVIGVLIVEDLELLDSGFDGGSELRILNQKLLSLILVKSRVLLWCVGLSHH